MDWTSVFEEDGTEDMILPYLMESRPTKPRLTRLVSSLYHHHHVSSENNDTIEYDKHQRHFSEESSSTSYQEDYDESSYTLRALYYLSINYILGVGCLGVPYAFAQAGFILCACILFVVTAFSFFTVLWVAETGIRLEIEAQEAIDKAQQQQQVEENVNEQSLLIDKQIKTTTTTKLLDIHHRYEVIDLVDHYLGPIHKFVYQLSLMALMYVGLLAYSQVFCSAIAELIWGQQQQESSDNEIRIIGLPQLIFGIMVVPLSCIELDEQVAVQSIMAGVRFLAIFIMIFGSSLALFVDTNHNNNSTKTSPPYWAPSEPETCDMSYTACFSGFGVAFSTSLFSQLFQHSIPGLLRPLKNQPEKIIKAPNVFGCAFLTTTSFYLLLGMSTAAYFGAKTRASVNLNFANFTFGFNESNTLPVIIKLLKIAAGVVVVFPALDTISVFPLIANTLGNNLYAGAGKEFIKKLARLIYKIESMLAIKNDTIIISGTRTTTRKSYTALPFERQKQLLERSSKYATIFWRLIAALPPLIGSLFATDLSFSLLLAGVAGVYVAFYAPSLLQLQSCRKAIVGNNHQNNIFSGWHSHKSLCYLILLFATFSLCVVLLHIRDALFG